MLEDDTTTGETFELYGPKEHSLADIAELVDREIMKTRRHVNVPRFLLKPAVEMMSRLIWFVEMCGDSVERQYIDQVIDPSAKTFKDLGIEPTDINNWTYTYLVSLLVPHGADVFEHHGCFNTSPPLPFRLQTV